MDKSRGFTARLIKNPIQVSAADFYMEYCIFTGEKFSEKIF